jgi:phosphoribosylaminoimidazolecarboxamide formyltransferase/IMP cyclohydrolase
LAKKIGAALISVFNKNGLEPLVKLLHSHGVTILSTGGTQSFIEALDIPVTAVENITDYPSILGGRVKTLHPKVFGGILSRRENSQDIAEVAEYQIPPIDLVVVDLYPFEETIRSKASEAEIIEKIDIGGVSLIRAAAKNFNDVLIVSAKYQYQTVVEHLSENNGGSTLDFRKSMAVAAFAETSNYDSAIFNHYNQVENLPFQRIALNQKYELRYGENPHQAGAFWGNFDELFEKHNGKQLSYNNLLDVDAALGMIEDFDAHTCIIIKHNNACGIATRNSALDAWNTALSCDNISAFGGVIIFNCEVDEATASEINKLFFEVLIAPNYTSDALEILTKKPNRIILQQKQQIQNKTLYRSALNGVLIQDRDSQTENESHLKLVTEKAATTDQVQDLIFAAKLAKHTKSNTIVLARNQQLIASGVGQTSRVDALKQAIEKAKSFGFELKDAVMASDAFFPFPDCVAIAHEAGITAVIQPGGSIKDQESIDYCNQHQMAMVVTGFRHFKH